MLVTVCSRIPSCPVIALSIREGVETIEVVQKELSVSLAKFQSQLPDRKIILFK